MIGSVDIDLVKRGRWLEAVAELNISDFDLDLDGSVSVCRVGSVGAGAVISKDILYGNIFLQLC